MTGPPRTLGLAVACVAAATLFCELTLTRIFSVLLFYHFSFFAVALAMAGLALGGLWVAHWPVRTADERWFATRLANLALAGAVIGLGQLALLALAPPKATPVWAAVLSALQWLPLFTVSGAFLATAFARRGEWIGELYGWDLAAAGGMCIVTIPLFRAVAGPAVLFVIPLLLALAAGLLSRRRARSIPAAAIGLVSAAALLLGSGSRAPLIRLGDEPPWTTVVFERWNEYSRIQGRARRDRPDEIEFVIDRSAATQMPRIPPGRARPDPVWTRESPRSPITSVDRSSGWPSWVSAAAAISWRRWRAAPVRSSASSTTVSSSTSFSATTHISTPSLGAPKSN